MFANRFTAFIDACSLTGALKRNLLLTLAEAEFFRIRWSRTVLDEVERAIEDILSKKGDSAASSRASRARNSMEDAFEEAMVSEFEDFMDVCKNLPDKNDAHVIAAALKTQANVIVSDNEKHFPAGQMEALNLEIRSTDAFIADTIELDHGRAVAAIRIMRSRFKRPEKNAEQLLLAMEAAGLIQTVNVLKPYVQSL